MKNANDQNFLKFVMNLDKGLYGNTNYHKKLDYNKILNKILNQIIYFLIFIWNQILKSNHSKSRMLDNHIHTP